MKIWIFRPIYHTIQRKVGIFFFHQIALTFATAIMLGAAIIPIIDSDFMCFTLLFQLKPWQC